MPDDVLSHIAPIMNGIIEKEPPQLSGQSWSWCAKAHESCVEHIDLGTIRHALLISSACLIQELDGLCWTLDFVLALTHP